MGTASNVSRAALGGCILLGLPLTLTGLGKDAAHLAGAAAGVLIYAAIVALDEVRGR